MSKSRIPQQSRVIPAGPAVRGAEVAAGRRAVRFGRVRKGVFRSVVALSVVALFGAGYVAGQVPSTGGGSGDVRDLGDVPLVAGSSSLAPGSISADEIGRSADGPADENPATIGGDGSGTDTGTADADTGTADTAGRSRGDDGSSDRDWVLQGDVIEIAGEDVLVCATGNGFGISHIGTTLREGASGEETRAEKDRLCATAFTVVGGLVLSGAGQGSMLEEERDVAIGATSAVCAPIEEERNALRCAANDDSLVTVWSVAP